MRALSFVAVIAAAMVMWAGPAGAAILYDSGQPSPGDTGGGGIFSLQSIGAALTFGSDVTITGWEVYIGTSRLSDATGVRLSIQKPDGGGLPGPIKFSADVDAPDPGSPANWTGVSGQSWNLGAGIYWFTIEAIGTFDGYLPQVFDNPLGRYAFLYTPDSPNWQWGGVTPYGFRVYGEGGAPVTGTAIPEPSAWALMLTGLGLAGCVSRSRGRRAPPARPDLA
jgi:hypothetical protein